MTRDELLALPPVISFPVAARALTVGVRVLRKAAKDGTLVDLGLQPFRRGSQLRLAKADLLRLLVWDP